MAATKVGICNLALNNLGITKKVQNIDTERTQEAQTCRDYYDQVIESVLKASPWPFATKFVDLALVTESPSRLWQYAYMYPADCLQFRRFTNTYATAPIFGGLKYDQFNQNSYQVDYKIVSSDNESSKLILVNMPEASAEYTRVITNPAMFSGDFTLMAAMLLSSHIAPALTGGDPFQLRERNYQLYNVMVGKVMANAYQEEPAERLDATSLENSRL